MRSLLVTYAGHSVPSGTACAWGTRNEDVLGAIFQPERKAT